MRRVYRLLISTLVILGIIAVAPAKTPVENTEQAICMVNDTDQIASADVKKKKKKKKKKGEKGGKGKKKKKGFFSKVFGAK